MLAMTPHGKLPALLLSIACALTTASARADGPTAGACATASDNAQPLRKAGSLRAAKEQLLVCVNKSCPAIVRDDCATQLNDVEKATPTVVFEAKDGAGGDVTAVTVTMDDAQLADHLDGTSLAVDPGNHHFVFKMPGAPPVAKDLVIREGEKDRHERIAFEPGSAGRSAAAGDGAAGPSRWPVYAAFGVGAVGLVVGAVSGVLALSAKSTLDSECPSKSGCPQNDVSALSTRAWVSNVGFAVGIVGAGVGTVLLLTSGGGDRPSVGISIAPSQVGLVGTFL
jgi:hypothetical protein